ncbi:MAG TPA: hypothetical protein VHO70_10810, partial [Chitinispirillaceae bacterium]|nr:hypothetical protein [Chitinispirillaceae bacterium]
MTGMIIGLDGKAAQNVQVTLFPSEYNLFADKPIDSLPTAMTNSSGIFSIEAPDTGNYSVEALNHNDGSCLIKFNIVTYHDSVCSLSTDTLHTPGSLTIVLGDENKIELGFLYVPGSRVGIPIDTSADSMKIGSVPVTILPVLYLSDSKNGL